MKKYLKQNKLFCIIFLFGLGVLMLQIISMFFGAGPGLSAFADGGYPSGIDKPVEIIPYNLFRDMLQGNKDSCAEILSGAKINQVNGGGLEGGYCGAFIGATKTVGLGLLLMFFLTELIDKLTKEQFDTETLIRMLIKYLAVEALFNNLPKLIEALFALSNEITADVGNLSSQTDGILNSVAQIIADSKTIIDILITVLVFLPWLLTKIMGLVVQAVCWSRLIDIILRGGFAPIGCASMAQEGFAGNGFRYLKKFFASCLQGAIIAGILMLSNKIGATLFHGMLIDDENVVSILATVISMLVVNFIQIMCIVKSGQFANEIAGA